MTWVDLVLFVILWYLIYKKNQQDKVNKRLIECIADLETLSHHHDNDREGP